MPIRYPLAVTLPISLMVIASFSISSGEQSDPPTKEGSPAEKIATIRQRLLTRDGKLTHEGLTYTTSAYQNEAVRLITAEANQVAKELGLAENLPISEAKLARTYIAPYGISCLPRGIIGNVQSRDYGYFVSVDHKLSYVERAHQDTDLLRWMEQYRWQKSRVDTVGAYQLATQWLAAARMDVPALSRDCQFHSILDPYANETNADDKFVPIYFVYWESSKNRAEGYGSVASVKLLAPTRRLISLRVEDSKYILRPQLQFTNLNDLLAQKN